MKRMLCLFLALILAVGICFSAPVTITASAAFTLESGEENTIGAEYTDEESKFKYRITKTSGDKAVAVIGFTGSGTEIEIPATVTINEIAYNVTTIDSRAFEECTALTSVMIPESVTKIGVNAFIGCTSLETITIPETLKTIGAGAFSGCTSLEKVKIPDSVTTIGQQTFSGCTSLSEVTIPNSVKTIGKDAFSDCIALTSIAIPDSVTTIGNSAFANCTALTSVTIPKDVTTIGASAFNGCTSLSAVTIGDGVTTIDDYAFSGCTALTTVTIPASVTSIDTYAFSGCTALTTITIPASVTSIVSTVFSGCTSLTSIEVDVSNSSYLSVEGVLFNKDKTELICYPAGKDATSYTILDSVTSIGVYAFSGCTSLASVTIPDSVTTIGLQAFYGCTSLTSVTIGKGVTTIGWGAFDGCTSLTSVTIPDSVTTIGQQAFGGCTSLTTVTIPDSVTTIGQQAFYGCTSLTSVTIGKGVTEIDNNAFNGCTNILLFVDKNNSYLQKYATDNNINYVVDGSGELGKLTFTPIYEEADNENSEITGYSVTARDKTISGALTIPSEYNGYSVTTIGDSAFKGCSELASVTIPDSITTIGSSAFNDCTSLTTIEIPDSVTSIGRSAFSTCTALTSVMIPESVTTIDNYTFYSCTALKSVTIPESVTSIGDYAFSGCTSLTSVTIPEIVTSIGDDAFGGCTSLTSVTIPESVTAIGDWAFSSCTELAEIKVDDGNTNYLSVDGILFNADKTELICYPAGKKGNYEIPTTVTEIAPGAFSGNTLLESVIIPDSVTTIGEGAFTDCTALTSVTIPDSVTTIGSCAFQGCTSLASVTIGDRVTTIGWQTFYDCTALTSVTIGKGVTEIDDDAFEGCASLTTVNVPCSWNENPKYTTFENSVTVDIQKHNYELGVCTACGEDCAHTGGTATCTTLAVCENCGDSYGDLAPHTYINGKCTAEGCGYACAHETMTDDDVCTTCGGNYYGADKTKDNVVWFYDVDTDTLTITGSGDMFSEGSVDDEVPWKIEYISSVEKIDIEYGVTSIGDSAFWGCDKLKSVTIPDSIKTIGVAAFQGCFELTSVTIPESVESIGDDAFYCCTKLTSVTIPKKVTEIGDYAFKYCTALTLVTIPGSETTIGKDAFYGCTNILLFVDKNNTDVKDYATTNNINYVVDGSGELEKLTFTPIYEEADNENSEITGYSVTDCHTSILGALTIPSTYNGKPVTKIGNGAFWNCILLKSVTIPDNITTIGSNAFNFCTELISITIPESVTEIGSCVFDDCSQLASISVDDANTKYSSEDGVLFNKDKTELICYPTGQNAKSYTIPDSVTTIGANAFYECTSLETITIPKSVEAIGNNAFYNCTNILLFVDKNNNYVQNYATANSINYVVGGSGELEKLTFTINEDGESYSVTGCDTTILGALTIPSEFNGKHVTEIGNNAFAYCDTLSSITIPESVTTIGDSAFSECTGLTSVTIPSSVKTIGYHAFLKCTGLQTVTIGENVTTIGDGAFADCSSLSSVIIPNSVTTIGKNAFDSCTNLESVTIGENVGKIDDGTFGNCTSLKTIKIPDSVKTIGAYAFDSCESLKSVTIGEKTETIGGYAFRDCSLLGEIKIPDSVKTIGNYAFDKCISLGTAIIGNEVKTIGDSAFGNCVNLKSLTIGKAVETIGELAFQQCPLLTEIVIPASVTEIGENALIGCSGLKYIFFEGTEEAQKDVADSIGIATNVHYGSSTHTFEENYTVDVEPTCTEKGSESQHCKYCDLTRNSRDVKENGHTSVNGGKIDVHTKCDVCGVTLSAEHEFTKTVIKAPTCTSQGVETWACECGYSETNNVEESDHNFVNHDGKVATCTEDGYYPYQTCTTCDYTTYHVDPAKGHDIVIDKAVEATCTKTGLTEGSHCSRCNDKTVKQNVIPTKAHTEVTVTGKAATCTATGLTDGKKCSVCGAVTKAQETIKATGHTTSVINKKDATTKDAGYTGDKVCSVCNAEIEKGKEIPKIIVSLATPTVTIKNTAKGISVNWNAIENARSYIVYRRVYNASTKKWSKWAGIKTGVTETCFVDGTVKLGTIYKYTVRAVNGDVKSGYVSTKALKYNVVPIVKIANTATGVKVAWSTAANATGYTVYRSQYNAKTKKWSGWKNMGTAKANKTSWVDKKVTSGVSYKYTVRAANGKILSSYKASASLMFLSQPTVKFANASTGVKVAWSKVKGATGYTVYRSELVDGKWTKWSNRGTAKANKSSWVDKKVTSGVTYKYTVRAINGKVKSSFVETKGLLYLAQPTVTVKAVSNGINVAWSQCEGATGYTVYRSEYNTKTKKWSKWSNRGTAKAEKSNWTDKKATKGVTYKYTVRAVNADTGAKSSYIASKNVKR